MQWHTRKNRNHVTVPHHPNVQINYQNKYRIMKILWIKLRYEDEGAEP
jgi:hypothetical protein